MTTTCPSCGAAASGKFCATCGSALAGATCGACRAPLTPGAKFCHRCGSPAGAAPAALNWSNAIPWAIAGIALLALVALLAGQRFGRGADGSGRPQGARSLSQGGMPPAGDISALSSEELAERLYNRVMAAAERGRSDTVQFFMPMALQAYQALDSMNVDQRYHLGRLAEVGGDATLAAAQADSILRRHPGHLLGLVLAARAARLRGDLPAATRFFARVASTQAAERARGLPEYEAHQNDIDVAIGESRKPSRSQ